MNKLVSDAQRIGRQWSFLPALFVLLVAVIFGTSGTARAEGEDIEEQRDEVRASAKEILAELYELQPEAQKKVENAAGYAVFSNFGLKILVAGSGKGEGLAVDNETGKETFMKMFEVQAGWGFGIKKFKVVWVFDKQKDFNEFVDSGWEFGSQATASAKSNDEGAAVAGAVSVSPGVQVYQITDGGLALELTVKGTKFYKDKDLN